MKVLVGCEKSQVIANAFREAGHEAYSNDIQQCSGGHEEWHIQGDVFEAVDRFGGIDLFIGNPPCTFISGAGNGYFNELKYGDKAVERKIKREEAVCFFFKMWNLPIKKICLENPVGYINSIMKPTQVVHPKFFGDAENKRTCLWLKGLPPLIHRKQNDIFGAKTHVDVVPKYFDKSGKPRYFTDSISGGTAETMNMRSKFFPGIAKSMAEQWGN